MDISMLNRKVTFQKNALVTDEIGNHLNEWADHYSCMASVSDESGREERDAGMKIPESEMSVTVRYCGKTSVMNTDDYRIVMDGDIYDIQSIDHLRYRKKALRFRCRRVRR